MKKRYIIGILLLAMIGVMIWAAPVLPVIQLPGETLIEVEKGTLFYPLGLTNTFIATVLTWIVVIIILLATGARSRSADEVPSGFYNVMEMIVEAMYGFVESSSGKWTKTFFPWFITIVLVVLVANWMELIPGVDSIGIAEDEKVLLKHAIHDFEEAHPEHAHPTEEEEAELLHEVMNEGGHFVNESGPRLLMIADEGERGNHIIPYVRAAATDLNFTLALAIISVVMTQFYGMRANGVLGYWGKFFTFNGNKIAANPLGLMDTLVGILEFISEISKILSFAFRLFGNIFAGQVLLFVIASLAAVANVAVFGLEFFVGAIQAAVFAMLTLTFMNTAVEEPHH